MKIFGIGKMNIKGGSDALFKSFIKSGMGQVKVPVRRGYEVMVMNFLETGMVWESNDVVLGVMDDTYVSIADELATADEEVTIDETWKSKIPTNLTILQRNGGGLDLNGLPCENTENAIAMGNSMLGPLIAGEGEDENEPIG